MHNVFILYFQYAYYDINCDIIDIKFSIKSYSSGWYKFPPKTRVLIKMMLLRTSIPFSITGGPTFIMNFETYTVVRVLF